MLVGTRECIHAGEAETIKYNALVESFCIHARLLIDFFENRRVDGAGTFAEPTYIAFEDGRLADSLLKKISTQVGHLSLKRTVDPSKMIDHATLEQIFLRLAAEIANFRRHLKPEYRSLWPSSLEVSVAPVMACAPQGMPVASGSAQHPN
jgi:hypothetical protein